jgi:L-ascorbate metabolism protein UlaG (beta-lactamase superfamily)
MDKDVAVELTKYTHSCVRLTDAGRVLVIDPGVFSESAQALAGADAVLVTHEHPDHLDASAVRAALFDNGDLRIWGPASIAEVFAEFPGRFTAVTPSETISVAGFDVETVGGQHAVIHPSIPVVSNVGYVIEGSFYHPGDSFVVPTKAIQTLLVPIHAPWSKVAEVIDFVVAVRAPQAFQIHDSLLTESGCTVVERHVSRIGGQYGSTYRHLMSGETTTV